MSTAKFEATVQLNTPMTKGLLKALQEDWYKVCKRTFIDMDLGMMLTNSNVKDVSAFTDKSQLTL